MLIINFSQPFVNIFFAAQFPCHESIDSTARFRSLIFPHHEYYLLKCHIFDTVKIGGFQQLC